MKNLMSPRNRLMAAIRREPHDRVPVAGVLMSAMQPDLMELNYTYEECYKDADKAARVCRLVHTEYEFDAISVAMFGRLESEAWGSRFDWILPSSNGYRFAFNTDWVVHNKKDLVKLNPYDPKKVPGMARYLEVISRLREEFPEVGLIGSVNGIGDLHTDVVNDVDQFPGDSNGHFITLYNNINSKPGFVHQVMEILVEGSIAWGKAQLAAGCDALWSHECAGYFNLPVAQYEEFLIQYNARIREGIGGIYMFNECHPQAYQEVIMDQIKPDVFHISVDLDISETGKKYGDRVCLMGNLALHKPTDLLCVASWPQVKEAAKKSLEEGKNLPGFILSPECEIHFGVPRQNVKTLSEAARVYGRRM
jgi:[methyl-Co(III) methanol-specific corrinoid protein]:coenzyme M methyltransferase